MTRSPEARSSLVPRLGQVLARTVVVLSAVAVAALSSPSAFATEARAQPTTSSTAAWSTDPAIEPPAQVPNRVSNQSNKVPVIFVPGISGSKLREVESHKVLWGRGANLLHPHDGGGALALTIPDGRERGPEIEAFAVLDRLSVFGIDKPVYGPLLDSLVKAGYRLGDSRQPLADATLYPFPYDWRRGNTEAAGQLLENLKRIQQARGGAPLEVDLVCQSNGGHICRYLSKYGGRSLEQAEGLLTSGAAREGKVEALLPAGISIRKIVFVATANGGAIRVLRELDRGRKYVPWIGRWIRPEVLFSFPSLFQDLPVTRQDLFLDPLGQQVEINLFDAASWIRQGWSIFGARSARRVARERRPHFWGTKAERQEYLATQLDKSRRFHDLLAIDPPGYRSPTLYSIQSVYSKTPKRALLVPEGPRSRLHFVGDRVVRRRHRQLEPHLGSPGDEHATLQSQAWFSPLETKAVAAETFYIEGGHFAMVLNPSLHLHLLNFLSREEGTDSTHTSANLRASRPSLAIAWQPRRPSFVSTSHETPSSESRSAKIEHRRSRDHSGFGREQ